MKALKLMLAAAMMSGFMACSSGDDADLDEESSFLAVGTAAPDFTLVTDDEHNGKRLSSFRGSYVVMEFWRSTCPDCRGVTQTVKALYGSYSPKGVAFIGVSVDTDVGKWRSYIDDNGLEWIQFHDSNYDSADALKNYYAVSWVPTFYLIDKEGMVLYATCYVERLGAALAKAVE